MNHHFRAPSASEMPDQPNPWATVRLRPEPRTLPRRARIALKVGIALFLSWWLLTWALALVGGL